MACIVVLISLGVLAWRSGGYLPTVYLAVGAACAATFGMIVIIRAPDWRPDAIAALGALTLYVIVVAVSTLWSPDVTRGLSAARLDGTYLALFALSLPAASSMRQTRALIWGVAVVATVTVGAGLVARLWPSVLHEGPIVPGPVGYRLAYPLPSSGAFGGLAGITTVLGLGLSADLRTSAVLRGIAAGVAVIGCTALYLSFSRGSWAATAVGLVVLAALCIHRRGLLAALLCIAPAVALAIAMVDRAALTVSPAAAPGQTEAGRRALPVVAAAIVGAIVARAALAHFNPKLLREPLPWQRARACSALALLFGTIVALGAGYAALGLADESRADRGNRAVAAIATEQWREFMRLGDPAGGHGTQRADVDRVALRAFAADRVRGDGAGGFQIRYDRERVIDQDRSDPDSLYLQALAETGALGVAALAVLIGIVLFGGAVASRRRRHLPRAEAAAAVAAFVVWALAAGVESDWQVPAVTAVGLVLGGAVLSANARRAAPAADAPG